MGARRCPVFRSLEFHQFHQGVTVGLPVLAFWRGDPVMWMWSRGDSSWLFVADCGYWNTVYDLSNCKWSIIEVLIRSSIACYSNSNLVNGLFCQIHVEDAYYKCVLQGHWKLFHLLIQSFLVFGWWSSATNRDTGTLTLSSSIILHCFCQS